MAAPKQATAEARRAAEKAAQTAHVKAMVAAAPPLTPRQRERVAAILRSRRRTT